MKSKSYVSILSIATLLLLLSVSSKICASDYTISFSGTGASTSVENVIVQNLTKGTTISVPAGNVLVLSEGLNAINLLTENNESLKIYPNPIIDKSTISFNSKSSGITQINVLALDGRKMVGIIKKINEGVNLFQLTLPRGAYTLQVTGIGFSNSAKVISQSSNFSQPNIIFIDSKKANTLQKSKSAVIPMTYTAGDLLLFKAYSGNYTSVLTDIITGNKTINFNFVECKDVDGNYYSTVTIGSQVWMAENLKTSKYRNNIAITDKTNLSTWGTSTTQASSNYATPSNSTTYGKLYNWYAVSSTNNLAPLGWHIPTDADWTSLSDFLGGLNLAGDKLKEKGNLHWATANTTATNITGFTALPGGSRSTDNSIYDIGNIGYWWSSTEGTTTTNGWYRSLSNENSIVTRGYYAKSVGMSVRCIMGEIPILSTTAITGINATSATSGGNVTSSGGATVTARGVCWSTTSNPTITDSKTTNGTGTGAFTSVITGLVIGSTYYVRAYATNITGTAYGVEVGFYYFLPGVATTAISAITANTAVSGGYASAEAETPISAKGVCWSTSSNPTITNYRTNNGALNGSFTSVITGLTAGNTYYVRAYATNPIGTKYGAEVSFSTSLPSATTTAITSITTTTAASGGNVTAIGGAAVTARGVCWSTTPSPTIALATKTSDGTGIGAFTSAITGLTVGYIYYVRAYATNSIGTAYGAEESFSTIPTITTTSVSAISTTTATSGGNITDMGGAAVTQRGVCWSTTPNPTIALATKTSDGTGLGLFTSAITGLVGSTTYYVRAYATNSIGTAYGAEVSFGTTPTVTTAAISSITATTAASGGNVTAIGGAAVTERGICWSTTPSPTIALMTKTSDGTGIGLFSSAMTGLTVGTTYYMRAYATNSIGTAYGAEVTFSTALPTITTTAISAITATSAISGGNASSPGGAPITARGVCWSTSSNPTTADSKTTNGTSAGIFSSTITGLRIDATYYVRAYATNAVGTNYGAEVSFTVSVPTVITTALTETTTASPKSGGNITSAGSSAITSRGVCWSTTANPTIANSKTTDGIGTGSFTSTIGNLSVNSSYHIRAYATSAVGTAYGAEYSFTTGFVVGYNYLGGKVAFLDASGIHGFVCAPVDQGGLQWDIQWYNGSNVVTGATNVSIETTGVYGITKSGGRKNTDLIISKQGAGTYAASSCATLTTGGAVAGDWYLPSIGELNQLFINQALLGGFATGNYWSSSESSSTSASYQVVVVQGVQGSTAKNSKFRVRAVRAF